MSASEQRPTQKTADRWANTISSDVYGKPERIELLL